MWVGGGAANAACFCCFRYCFSFIDDSCLVFGGLGTGAGGPFGREVVEDDGILVDGNNGLV